VFTLCHDAVVVDAAADGGGGDGGRFKRPDLILAAAVRTVSASVGATPETEADLSGEGSRVASGMVSVLCRRRYCFMMRPDRVDARAAAGGCSLPPTWAWMPGTAPLGCSLLERPGSLSSSNLVERPNDAKRPNVDLRSCIVVEVVAAAAGGSTYCFSTSSSFSASLCTAASRSAAHA